jgi:ABC-type polysaccharide/polyol phosphate transport system ATPase subunit
MLGLSKKDIAKRFDEIVSFAELEAFIDAPVKTYSSGMYMRLGFAVASRSTHTSKLCPPRATRHCGVSNGSREHHW